LGYAAPQLDGDTGQLGRQPGGVEAQFHEGVLVGTADAVSQRVEAVFQRADPVVEVSQAVHHVEQQLVGCRCLGAVVGPVSPATHGGDRIHRPDRQEGVALSEGCAAADPDPDPRRPVATLRPCEIGGVRW